MKKLLLCLSLLLSCLPPCVAQQASGPFADVLPGTAPYADIAALDKAGIVIGPTEGTYTGRRILARYQFAALAAPLLKQIAGQQTHLDADMPSRLLISPPALAALQDLARQFAPELERLGVNENMALARLAELKQTAFRPLVARPFSDVPKDHWAASAVETLRRRGIVEGYPHETFSLPQGR